MNIEDLAAAILYLIILNPNYYTNYFMGLGYGFFSSSRFNFFFLCKFHDKTLNFHI